MSDPLRAGSAPTGTGNKDGDQNLKDEKHSASSDTIEHSGEKRVHSIVI
jgi:hypothetical protein